MRQAPPESISPELVLVASPEEAEEARRSLPLLPAALAGAPAPTSAPDPTEGSSADPLVAELEVPLRTRPTRGRRRLRVAAGLLALAALGTLGVFVGAYELRSPGADGAALRSAASVNGPSPTSRATGPSPTSRATGPSLTSHAPLKPPASAHAGAAPRPSTSSTLQRSSVSTSVSPTKKTPPAFVPARVFVWVKQRGADSYLIRFFRNDRLVLQGKTTEPRYAVPAPFHFKRGAYRWEVMPVSAGKVGRAIVTSRFAVA